MSDDGLLNIGAFSVMTGLSISALRHYDEIELLRPASVDARTGYRRYGPEQVATGRLIRALRAIELPIDDIRAVTAADGDANATRDALIAHRATLVERSRSLATVIDIVDDYIENGVPMRSVKPCRVVEINLGVDDVEAARRFYEAAFEVEFSEDEHGDGTRHLLASFGSWPSDEFFLLNITDGADDPHRAGRANFGLLVDDLDAVHKRAIAAGGTEISPPRDVAGMPRFSSIVDPGHNLVNLYQNA